MPPVTPRIRNLQTAAASAVVASRLAMSLLRSIATLLLGLVLVAGLQGTVLVELMYVLRHDHVATHFCVNKDNPDANCNGKCFLAKRVADAEGHADGDAVPHTIRPAVPMVSTLPVRPAVPPARERTQPHATSPASPSTDPPPADIFRPPWSACSA